MKKIKQVLAILLILILIGLYVSTLVFAIIGSERAMVWLKISIYATIVLPLSLIHILHTSDTDSAPF